MQVVGHRGAPKEAFENSFLAYECAISGDADRIELDVHLLKDNSLVISHDPDLKYAVGQSLNCAEASRNDVKKMQLKDGSEIPFLDEVLDRYVNKIEFNIEIKENRTETAEQVLKLIRARNCQSRIVVSSFQPEMVQFYAEKEPTMRRACLWGPDFKWPNVADYSPLRIMEFASATILHPYVHLVDEGLMDQARHRGWEIVPYVGLKNDDEATGREALWSKLKDFGVSGLCSNYPRELRRWLNNESSKL